MLSKQSSKVNEATVVFVGNNEKVRFSDVPTRLESEDDMASLEEGEEAAESEEGMTTFSPYVTDKNRGAVLFSREVSERERAGQRESQPPQRRRTVASTSTKARAPEATGANTAKGFFRMIRSSISSAAGLPGRDPPSSSGAARRQTLQGQNQQRVRGQARMGPNQPSRAIPHPSSAPVLNKPPSAAHKQTPASRVTRQPARSGRNTSRETSPSSPLVIEDMASYGPGSGRGTIRPPTVTIPSGREKISPPRHEGRSKSEEPSPTRPKFSEDNRQFLNTVHTSCDDTDITLVSYSDVHRLKAAQLRKTGSAASALGGARGVASSSNVPLYGLKKQLNRQDVLKRIGSIENDEESTSDLRRYWMPDKACKECSECSSKFSWFLRRHHCRICGRIFCNACCYKTIPGGMLRSDLQGNLRVCNECHAICLENSQSKSKLEASVQQQLTDSYNSDTVLPSQTLDAPPPSVSESGILRSVSGPMTRTMSARPVSMLSPHKSWDEASLRSPEIGDMSPSRMNSLLELDRPTPTRRSLTATSRRQNFDSPLRVEQREDKIVALEKDEIDYIISGVWSKFLDPESGLQPQNHRYRLRNFPKSYTAQAIVEWLVTHTHVESRDVAIRVGQTLVDTNRLKIVSSIETRFRDNAHLYLELGGDAHLPVENPEEPTVQGAPKWFYNLPQDGDSEFESSQDIATVLFKKDPTEPSITISSLPRISESEPETSITTRSSRDDEYLIISREGEKKDGQDTPQGDDSSSVSPSSTPILPEVLVSRSPGSTDPASRSRSPVPSFDMIGTDDIIKTLSISRVTGLESASEAARDVSGVDSKRKAETFFSEEHDFHFDALMVQLIKSFGLSLSWLDVVKPLVKEAARNVKTNLFPDDVMDINQYVKVKKIPGGRQSNSNLVYGVVCTKNVTHKKMKTSVQNPSILLLKCAFEFQRRENTLSYFDTLQLQEEQYLKNVVAKVQAFNPSIILVQKSMSRLALEMLYELGIIVAVNVRHSVMSRVARCTKGDILTSLDQLFFDVQLGHCGHFYVRNYTLPDGIKKTLMYFDLCEPQYGCVITLQGALNRELKKVKKITQFGLHIAHNSNLETAFLIDEFAWPKSGTSNQLRLMPSSDDYSPTPSTPEWPLYPSLAYPLEALSPTELTEKINQLGMSYEREEGDKKEEEEEKEKEERPSLFTVTYEEEEREEKGDGEEQQMLSAGGEDVKVSSDTPSNLSSDALSIPSQSEVTTDSKAASPSQLSLTEQLPKEEEEKEEEESILDDECLDRVESGLLLKIATEEGEKEREEKGRSDLANSDSATKLPNRDVLEEVSVVEFQKTMGDRILSISPGVQLTIPYLQTVRGRKADARRYLPRVIYWSNAFDSRGLTRNRRVRSCDKSLSFPSESSDVEMGIMTRPCDVDPEADKENQNSLVTYHHQPSYKSVSSHPLTSSIFLLQANSNEMKAAMADYRARASLSSEENAFFFPSAKLACDYQLHLQNVFNAYQHYNFDIESSLTASGSREGSEAREEEKEKESKKKKKRKGHWLPWNKHHEDNEKEKEKVTRVNENDKKSAILSMCDHDNPLEDDSFELHVSEAERGEDKKMEQSGSAEPAEPAETAELTAASSNSELVVSSEKDKDSQFSDDSHKTPQSKRGGGSGHRTRGEPSSSSSRFSDNFATLDDLDKGHTKSVGEPEEELGDASFEQWATGDQHIDCLDPYNHQGISILFSNTCFDGNKHLSACVPPCIIPMFFYGRNDISLGEFLQRYCFRPYYRCPTCGVEMAKHKRHIVHGSSAIYITMQQIDATLLGSEDRIFTWLACKHCAQCTPYTTMSEKSFLFSFAKFLELKFHCDSYVTRYQGDQEVPCSHSLHRDYVQYFCYKNKLAAFLPATTDILEVLLPPQVLVITTPHYKYHHDYASEIKHVQRKIERAFDGLIKKLTQYKVFELFTREVEDNIASAKEEREALRNKDKLLKNLAVMAGFMEPLPNENIAPDVITPNADQVDENLYRIQDGIEELKRSVTEVVDCWNIYLEVLDAKVRERYSFSKKQRDGEGSHLTTEIAFTRSPRDSPVAKLLVVGDAHTHAEEEDGSNRGSTRDLTDSITPIHTPADGSPVLQRRQGSSGQSGLSPLRNTHSRNLSDGGVKDTEEKHHKRQLSESFAAAQKNEKPLPTSTSSSAEKLESKDHTSSDALNGGGGATTSSSAAKESTDGNEKVASGSHGDGDGCGNGRSPGTAVPCTTDNYETTRRLNVAIGGSSQAPPTPPPTHTDTTTADTGNSNQGEQHTDGNGQGVPAKTAKVGAANGVNGMSSDSLSSSRQHHKRQSGAADSNNKRAARNSILSRPFQKLDHPFDPSEHHTMYRLASIPVAVYENEPTSIIAFALTSRQYAEELQALEERKSAMLANNDTRVTPCASPKTKKKTAESERTHGSSAGNLRTAAAALNFKAAFQELKKKGSAISLFSNTPTAGVPPPTPAVGYESKLDAYARSLEFSGTESAGGKSHEGDFSSSDLPRVSPSGISLADEVDGFGKGSEHISLEFATPDKSVSFFCKVYYADEFRKLRERIFPSGEDRYVRSLARCVKYEAKGGKSRSTFCKVADDRFIMKHIKTIEISSFEQFAPHYLQHVNKALEEKRPLALAKIVGAYSIGFRNTKTGNSKRLDVLVMENLLYGHAQANTKLFDLKGSTRSRYIDPSKDSSGDVLLDNNYLNFISQNPVYVYPHSKSILMQAIFADAEFLEENSIMDYSLLTCIDSSTGELVVGIIDYVRTFTLDKRMEMMLKKAAGRGLPTIVDPELYRKRFCEAIDRYFTVIPDEWTGLGADVPEGMI